MIDANHLWHFLPIDHPTSCMCATLSLLIVSITPASPLLHPCSTSFAPCPPHATPRLACTHPVLLTVDHLLQQCWILAVRCRSSCLFYQPSTFPSHCPPLTVADPASQVTSSKQAEGMVLLVELLKELLKQCYALRLKVGWVAGSHGLSRRVGSLPCALPPQPHFPCHRR